MIETSAPAAQADEDLPGNADSFDSRKSPRAEVAYVGPLRPDNRLTVVSEKWYSDLDSVDGVVE